MQWSLFLCSDHKPLRVAHSAIAPPPPSRSYPRGLQFSDKVFSIRIREADTMLAYTLFRPATGIDWIQTVISIPAHYIPADLLHPLSILSGLADAMIADLPGFDLSDPDSPSAHALMDDVASIPADIPHRPMRGTAPLFVQTDEIDLLLRDPQYPEFMESREVFAASDIRGRSLCIIDIPRLPFWQLRLNRRITPWPCDPRSGPVILATPGCDLNPDRERAQSITFSLPSVIAGEVAEAKAIFSEEVIEVSLPAIPLSPEAIQARRDTPPPSREPLSLDLPVYIPAHDGGLPVAFRKLTVEAMRDDGKLIRIFTNPRSTLIRQLTPPAGAAEWTPQTFSMTNITLPECFSGEINVILETDQGIWSYRCTLPAGWIMLEPEARHRRHTRSRLKHLFRRSEKS